MSATLNELTTAIDANNEKDVIEKLKLIVAQGEDIELQNNNILKQLIKYDNEKIIQAFVEVAAELSKKEQNRRFFTDKDLIEYLLSLLQKEEESLVVGAIRALGNICYENEEARTIIDKQGLSTVISILEKDHNRKNNLLTLKVSGFLVNLLISNDDLQKAALKFNIIEVIEKLMKKYLKSFKENQMLFAFLLTILNHVIDYIDDQNIPFTEDLCCTIIDIFKLSSTPEISVLCLEILHGQSEKGTLIYFLTG